LSALYIPISAAVVLVSREFVRGKIRSAEGVAGTGTFGILFLWVTAMIVDVVFFGPKYVSVGSEGLSFGQGRRKFSIPWQEVASVDVVEDLMQAWPRKFRTTIRLSFKSYAEPQYQHMLKIRKSMASDGYTHMMGFWDTSQPDAIAATKRTGVRQFSNTETVAEALRIYAGEKYRGFSQQPPPDSASDGSAAPASASDEPAVRAVVAHPGRLHAAFWLGVVSVVLLAVGQVTLGLVDFHAIRSSIHTSKAVTAADRDVVVGVVARTMVLMWPALVAAWVAVALAWSAMVPRRPARWWSAAALAALGLLIVGGMTPLIHDLTSGLAGYSLPAVPFDGLRAATCTAAVAMVVAGLVVRSRRRPGVLPVLLLGWAMFVLVVVLFAWLDGRAWVALFDLDPLRIRLWS